MIIFRKGGTIKRVIGGGGGGVGRIKIHAKRTEKKKVQQRRSEEKKSRRVNYIAGLLNCTRLNGTLAATSVLQF